MLDAGAFYAGVPFASQERYHTTPQVLAEVRHIKGRHGAIDALIDAGRLAVSEAGPGAAARAAAAARGSGDAASMSEADASALALCAELRGELVTDDFAVSNAAALMGIRVLPVMTGGIRRAGRWVGYCAGCGLGLRPGAECPRCGLPARRRLEGRRPARRRGRRP